MVSVKFQFRVIRNQAPKTPVASNLRSFRAQTLGTVGIGNPIYLNFTEPAQGPVLYLQITRQTVIDHGNDPVFDPVAGQDHRRQGEQGEGDHQQGGGSYRPYDFFFHRLDPLCLLEKE